MVNRLPLAFAAALAVLLAPPTNAQTKLDLFSAIAEVDASHPLATSKREELRATESGLSAAKQQRLPTLSVQTSKPVTVDAHNIYTTRVQQPLFAGGRIDAGIERSEAQIAEAQANLGVARRDLMVRTASAFIEVIKGKARLAVANRSVSEHERLLESIDRRVKAEISPDSDLMLTRSRLSQSQTERSQVALALQRAEDTLAELLSRKPPELIEPPLRPPPPFIELQSALAAGEAFAPEIKRASAQESIAVSDLDIQKAAAFPTVFARHDQNSGSLNPGYARSQTYLGVEFVPGAGLSVASQIQAAKNRQLAAIEARRAAEKDTRDRIRSLWAESGSLKRQLESAQNYVSSAQIVSDSFARQFVIGRKTWLEVLNAIREGALAELSLTDILWSSRLTDLRLEIETGKFTLENMRPAPEIEIKPVAQNRSTS